MKISLAILASGFSERFGENKLLKEIDGKNMAEKAAELYRECGFYRKAVITAYNEVKELARKNGYEAIINGHPENGISESIKIGVSSLCEADAIMFAVADQPYLKRETVKRLMEACRQNPDKIILPESESREGNPRIFPKALFGELAALEGDTGGKKVCSSHRELIVTVPAEEKELFDIDTKSDLQ